MTPVVESGLVIALFYVSAGIAIAGALHGVVLAPHSDQPKLFWIYATLCACVAGFQVSMAKHHVSTTLEAAILSDRQGIFFALPWMPLLVAFVANYMRHPRTKQYVRGISMLAIVFLVLNAFLTKDGRFAGARQLVPVDFLWGERLVVLVGEATVLSNFVRLVIYLVYLWGVWQAVMLYRQGKKLPGALIGAAFVALLISSTAANLKDWGLMVSLHTAGFGFVFLILCFTFLIANQIRETREALQRTADSLSAELRSHRATRDKVEYLAYHDKVTDLPNRVWFLAHLTELMAVCKQAHGRMAIILVDLDQFDVFNNTLGHDVGDKLLTQVALRLRAQIKESDIVARLSNDEFVVVARNLGGHHGAELLAEELLQMLRLPLRIDSHLLSVTASIGIVMFTDGGETAATLLSAVNLAMHEAKVQGGNKAQFYRLELSKAIQERQHLAEALRTALENNQFELHYQPIVMASDGRVVSFEALIRWHHPTDGQIPPDRFIPVAEKTHLILPIGDWVIEEACRTLAGWRQEGLQDIYLAINLSVQQLYQTDLHAFVADTLSRYGLIGSDIELEITESVMMRDPEKSIAQLQELREMGVRISIDDFGTGYSSLSYLKRLPVDTLKIDRAFVGDIETDANDVIICATAINMASGMQLRTIAEGVETIEQAEVLQRFGCDMLQGYLYSRPMPASEVLHFLERHHASLMQ